jgi:undecaprenyl-diphosphatase
VTLIQAALLGIVQGLTEFLPVSSSAHLILARAFFNWDSDQFGLAFDVACHVGTLLAILVYFRHDLWTMALSVPAMFRRPLPEPARQMWLIAIGTVPAIVVGLLFKHAIEDHARTPVVAGVMLAIGAVAMLAAERTGRRTRTEQSLRVFDAGIIGCAQAAALVPGVSRSGATLTAALFLGMRREAAASFVFLLAIPAILGAAGTEAPEIRHALRDPATLRLFAIGVVTSACVGYLAVKYFIRYLSRHSLDVFAWYRLALAATVAVWLVVHRAA